MNIVWLAVKVGSRKQAVLLERMLDNSHAGPCVLIILFNLIHKHSTLNHE